MKNNNYLFGILVVAAIAAAIAITYLITKPQPGGNTGVNTAPANNAGAGTGSNTVAGTGNNAGTGGNAGTNANTFTPMPGANPGTGPRQNGRSINPLSLSNSGRIYRAPGTLINQLRRV
ncbi:hypothetical protein C7N43_34690 [Sphingobacteriales bacterium UPWRP_1]|nr:hypothetical protein C7N43_34690 [Sphingobacteriales bacterium UPWRP_1]